MVRMMRLDNKLLLFLEGFAALNVIWYSLSLAIGAGAFPTPAAVYRDIGKVVSDRLWLHALASLLRALGGIALAVAAGVPLGLWMASGGVCSRLLNPLVYLAYPVPKTALLPVVLLVFGLGECSKIIIVALIVVFQIAVVTRGAALHVPRETYRHMASMGASGFHMLRHVTLPAILPELFTNTKVSVGTALSVLFFTEAYGTRRGLGWYIMDAWGRVDYAGMYLGILSIGILGFLLFAALDALEARACRWKLISGRTSPSGPDTPRLAGARTDR